MNTRKLMLAIVLVALLCSGVRFWDYWQSRQDVVLQYRTESSSVGMMFDMRIPESAANRRKAEADLRAKGIKYHVRYGRSRLTNGTHFR